jgi:hypothetical protein
MPPAHQEKTMTTVVNRLTALALAIAASAAINLTAHDTASAREAARTQAYSEGLWREPSKPSGAPVPAHGGAVVAEPGHGIAKAPPASGLPPSPR